MSVTILFFIKNIILILGTIIPLLLAVAYYTLGERKLMASIQRRVGPNVTGVFGLLQPIADGIKLVLKEMLNPYSANMFLFFFAPLLTFIISVWGWSIMPIKASDVFVDVPIGLFLFFAISSLGVYGVIIAGWASNSKYAFLGAIRSAAQMISYELSLSLGVIPAIMCSGSLNFLEIVQQQKVCWNVIPLLPVAIAFFILILAETNRVPFDLPEAEAEIVAGYNIEYSGVLFALFFLGEYSSMILFSVFFVVVFLGAWLPIPDGFLTFLQDCYMWLLESIQSISSLFCSTTLGDVKMAIVLIFFGFFLALLGRRRSTTLLIPSIIFYHLFTAYDCKVYLQAIPTQFFFFVKIVIMCYFFVWVRATFPRYRYDQVLTIGWKFLLPLTLAYFYITVTYLFFTDGFVYNSELVGVSQDMVLYTEIFNSR